MGQSGTEVRTEAPIEVVHVPIVVPVSARLFAVWRMCLAFFLALAALGVAFGNEDPSGEVSATARGIAILVAAVAVPIGAVSGWSNLRSAFARRARLEVLPDRLAIYHRGVFRAPLAIAREDVEVVGFDDRPFRYKRSGDHQRFDLKPEGSEEERQLRWLFSRAGGAPLPFLGQVYDIPNLAVLFTEPKVLRPVRRWQKAFPSKIRMGPPLHRRRSRGFLARIKDAGALREALEPWGIVRSITWADLDSHAPDPSEHRRVRRLLLRDDGILALLVLGQAAIPLVIALSN